MVDSALSSFGNHCLEGEIDFRRLLLRLWLGRPSYKGIHTTRWSSRLSSPQNFRVLRDQICTTKGPAINCVMKVDFS